MDCVSEPCVVSSEMEIIDLTSLANNSAWVGNRQASRFDAFTISTTAWNQPIYRALTDIRIMYIFWILKPFQDGSH